MKSKYCINKIIGVILLMLQSCSISLGYSKHAKQEHCNIAKTLSVTHYSSGDEDNIFSSGERRNQQQFLKGFGNGAKETFNDLLDLPEHILSAAKNIPRKTWDILSNPTESCDNLVDALRALPELPAKIANHLSEKYEEYKNLSEEEQSLENGKFVFEALKFYVSSKYINLVPTKENLQSLGFAAGKVGELEKIAKKFNIQLNNNVAKNIIIHRHLKVQEFISQFRKSSILREILGEFLDMTIEQALSTKNTTIRKLLINERFSK